MNDGAYNYFSSLVLQFLGWISSLIYGMVSLVTQGFFNLSYIQIFKSDVVEQITARLYVVLAVFMIFKLAFSLIQYLVSPDQVNDKQAGMGKLVSRTATAFIMLIGVPIIFTEFVFGPEGASPDHTYQAIIARTIPRIILGSNVDTSNSDVGRSMGETMAATAFSAFVQPREGCNAPSLTTATISDIADATYARCSDVVDGGESSIFAYDYNWLFGLAVGLLMLVIMLFFTVDIAIRAIKLGILRIVAPIPIISYVDPKSAKDGAFNNWLKSLISTFLELFIKVAVIYIIIFIINELTSAGGGFFDNAGLDAGEQMYATVFIIIGMLLFAMQASAFIKNIFGIKDQGLGTGLGMLMGGAGALLAGGGIAGMAKGMMQGASDGAQGKASFGNFNKGKELAAKTAKGQAHAQRKAERQAAKLGYDDARMSDLKQEASAAEEELAIAQAEMQADPSNVEKQQAYRAALARSKRANKAVEDAKEIRKNPALAKARGDAYSRSGYAIALAKHNIQHSKPVTGAAAAIASTGVYRGVQNMKENARNNPYEQDRVNGGGFINQHDYATIDEYNNRNTPAPSSTTPTPVTPSSTSSTPLGDDNVGNYDIPPSQQAYSDDDWMDMMNEGVQNSINNQPNNGNNNNNGQGGPGTGGIGGTP
ncbi:putative uncharacterized protein [Bacillus sp. CAG:988]|nr:putative uncharacterized protein [Bacillus sp. CAG:988]